MIKKYLLEIEEIGLISQKDLLHEILSGLNDIAQVKVYISLCKKLEIEPNIKAIKKIGLILKTHNKKNE